MDKKLIEQVAKRNTREYNLHKASEEMQELGLVLTQYLLKPEKVDEQEITYLVSSIITKYITP